jgi:flagellar L-ring protein precursor FlgH
MRGLLICALALLLPACAYVAPPQAHPAPVDDPLPVSQSVRKGQSGGVFAPEAAWLLTSDSRAFRSGDVVTVKLEEATQSKKNAGTKFDKSSSVAIQPLTIAGKTFKTDVGSGAKRDFDGNASSTQDNALNGSITVIVQEVLPNGLLRVGGEKTLYLNQGDEFIRLRGYVRAADIDTDNRVSSQRIANARIAYSGQGALADANAPGWLTRFFASPWMPF